MVNILKKCGYVLISILGFMFLSIFTQTPVVSTFSDDRIHVSNNLTGDTIRIIVCIAFVLLSLWFLSSFAKRLDITFNLLQFKQGKINKNSLVIYSSVTLFLTLVYVTILYVGNGYNVGSVPTQILEMKERPIVFILYLLTTIVTQPILEEILYRGILQEKLSRYIGWGSIVVTSLIFSYSHDYQIAFNSQLISSLIYGLAYYSTDDIRVSSIAHCLHNFAVVMVVILLG
ncbi:CPBP family intramembrane glutamic endopeptidase [Streptococcus suis]|uniref:CPBP family intramembrane glutamic endopeptidase n=1 Tax=Streptococcus suis TaxID=1307 RepID=UPI000CF4281F|nr:type II CAAX endopeptidase family protein [Streptococcus suis]MCL4934126.1 CPBP family intramembrane metalloprotease [Streptococcus suis]